MTNGPHPAACQGCRGTGWTDGPPITETVGGRPHPYTTVKPCDHDWWHDDTGWNPTRDEPLHRVHPRAQAAFAHRYTQGIAELDAIRPPQENP